MDPALLVVAALVVVVLVLALVVQTRRVRRLSGGPVRPPRAAALTLADLPVATQEQVWRLVHGGRKIEAIKLVREQTRLGLKEAKELVDRL